MVFALKSLFSIGKTPIFPLGIAFFRGEIVVFPLENRGFRVKNKKSLRGLHFFLDKHQDLVTLSSFE